MALAPPQSTVNISRGDKVYGVAALPFRAMRKPAQSVTSALHKLYLWDLQHFLVIIKTSSPPSNSKASLFHFQPEDPKMCLRWHLRPCQVDQSQELFLEESRQGYRNKEFWFVGSSAKDSQDMALKFNNARETGWRMGIHDCDNYANGLVKRRTSEKHVLECLRRGTAWLI